MSSNSLSKLSKGLNSRVSNILNMEGNTISRKRSLRSRLENGICSIDGNGLYVPYSIQDSSEGIRKERIVLNDVFFVFNGELLSLGKVILPNTDKSLGFSFPVVDPNSGNMCSSCKEFFDKYSRKSTVSYLHKAGLQLESDGHVSLSSATSERHARSYILQYCLLIIRDLRSLEKLCFDFYVGPFSGERSKCGEGLFRTKSGYSYHGSFEFNHFNGNGSLSSTSCIHRGYFQTSVITGLGEVIDPQNHYIGEMEQGYANGLGWKEDNKHYFIGCFQKGRVNGTLLHIPERTRFSFGQFKNGYAYHVERQNSIEGFFVNNVPQGVCVQTNEHGSLYIGNTQNWKPHGEGVSIHPLTRTIYIGSWKNGEWEGNGKRISYEESARRMVCRICQQSGLNSST